jgi:hypothetical protein
MSSHKVGRATSSIGYNAQAATASWAAVLDFLK